MVHCILYISIDQVSINSVLDESDTKVGYDTMNFASSQTTQPKVMDSSLFSSLWSSSSLFVCSVLVLSYASDWNVTFSTES